MKNSAKVNAATTCLFEQIKNSGSTTHPVVEQVVYLYERWQDEKEYEDFSDYIEYMEKTAKEFGQRIVDSSKRPFSFSFTCDESDKITKITIKAKGRKLAVETTATPKPTPDPKFIPGVFSGSIQDLKPVLAEPAQEVVEITENEAMVLNWIATNDYQSGETVVGHPVWAPEVSDFDGMKKRSLAGVISSLSKKSLIEHVSDSSKLNDSGDGRTSDTVAITELGLRSLQAWEAVANVKNEDEQVYENFIAVHPELEALIAEPEEITDLEAKVLSWLEAKYEAAENQLICIEVPKQEDFKGVMNTRALAAVLKSLSAKSLVKIEKLAGTDKVKIAMTEAARLSLAKWNSLEVKQEEPAATEEVKKGRGYANAGKKYVKSGSAVDKLMLGESEVKKGDKIWFTVGNEEVCGIFSHVNKCKQCPEGYAIIKFAGKSYERRQSRVWLPSAK